VQDRVGGGVHPAIVRAQARAFALSVTPGNRRRNSIAADNSPSSWNAVRMAAASASVTANIAPAWVKRAPEGKHLARAPWTMSKAPCYVLSARSNSAFLASSSVIRFLISVSSLLIARNSVGAFFFKN
jgi:hypothetical protein